MKRWFLLALVLLIVIASTSLLILRARLTMSKPVLVPQKAVSHLVRVPHSAFKYDLCGEVLAFALATPDNPYKTDHTFHDPFRNTDDTIIPRFLGFDTKHNAVSFSVVMVINQVATFKETITNVSGQDGISILIPDTHDQLQQSSVPQFIITLPNERATIAVLDYTCPEQWIWTTTRT